MEECTPPSLEQQKTENSLKHKPPVTRTPPPLLPPQQALRQRVFKHILHTPISHTQTIMSMHESKHFLYHSPTQKIPYKQPLFKKKTPLIQKTQILTIKVLTVLCKRHMQRDSLKQRSFQKYRTFCLKCLLHNIPALLAYKHLICTFNFRWKVMFRNQNFFFFLLTP